ncbi:MAG: hypothetical protein M1586_01845 [Patescibacteria group bacterium]|nr:hypothetical protein [Patescibacteria group bacterium]MCL5262025.1 hypothetical protein [Patescibacteria group bacterium]
MNNRKGLYIILILVVIIAAVIFGMSRRDLSAPGAEAGGKTEENTEPLSEEPDKSTFSNYFTRIYLGKLEAGVVFDPAKVIKTKYFTAGEQFCVIMDMKSQIPAKVLSTAIYDRALATYASPRSAGFPRALGPGNSVGCENLQFGPGEYELKTYINNTLISVLPFYIQ